jgi:predicted nucleic acid-binding protein
MRVVYADTGAFLALIWARDRDHGRMREHYLHLRQAGARLVTSDPVIGETATRLRYDAGLDAARTFHQIVEEATTAGSLAIRESDAELRRQAFAWMRRYDGLRLSYADAIGAAVATQLRADAVFGVDQDFRVMGFTLEP